jgi:hypothetical protein
MGESASPLTSRSARWDSLFDRRVYDIVQHILLTHMTRHGSLLFATLASKVNMHT